jgi:hypothetical protein
MQRIEEIKCGALLYELVIMNGVEISKLQKPCRTNAIDKSTHYFSAFSAHFGMSVIFIK